MRKIGDVFERDGLMVRVVNVVETTLEDGTQVVMVSTEPV